MYIVCLCLKFPIPQLLLPFDLQFWNWYETLGGWVHLALDRYFSSMRAGYTWTWKKSSFYLWPCPCGKWLWNNYYKITTHCTTFYDTFQMPVVTSTARTVGYIETILKSNEIKSNQLYAVSRTQQDRQREPSVKTLRSPLSAEFWRHCVLNGRTQRRA